MFYNPLFRQESPSKKMKQLLLDKEVEAIICTGFNSTRFAIEFPMNIILIFRKKIEMFGFY
tara:strand:+ start:6646 stop:6828 length:183 start_codon:yes stop_codon:yes gene_type:complete